MLAKQLQPLGARHHLEVALEPKVHLRAVDHGARRNLRGEAKGVVARLREQVRDSDTVARLRGDEFVVILNSINTPQDAAVVAEKIIAAIAASFRLGDRPGEVKISTSIGIAVYPGDSLDRETLIKCADAAMYRAKTHGNCYRFWQA